MGVGTTVEEAERQLILKTLESTHNNKTRAAEILGISLKTLHNKLKEYGAQESRLGRRTVEESFKFQFQVSSFKRFAFDLRQSRAAYPEEFQDFAISDGYGHNAKLET